MNQSINSFNYMCDRRVRRREYHAREITWLAAWLDDLQVVQMAAPTVIRKVVNSVCLMDDLSVVLLVVVWELLKVLN